MTALFQRLSPHSCWQDLLSFALCRSSLGCASNGICTHADLPLLQGSVAHAQWWDTASPQTPYHYIRIEQQDDHDILVVGGGDHLTGESNSAAERLSQAGRRTYVLD